MLGWSTAVAHTRLVQCSPSTASIVGVFVSTLLIIPYPKALLQRHLSQKHPSIQSVQAREVSPLRIILIALVLQALARVGTHFCFLQWSRYLRTL